MNVSRFALTALLPFAVVAPTLAAPPKAAKPAAKPVKVAAAAPAKAKGPILLGTTQLPGDFGALNQAYTIGKSSPINFTLNRVEYSPKAIMIGNNCYIPTKDQKVLVLHYTVHNPLPQEQRYGWPDIKFTAVDATDTNRDYIQAVAREGTQEPLAIVLKPAQKLEVYSAIMVPAEGIVPKLIVEREKGAPVVRYDLHGKATPLAAPFADPADNSGASLLKEVPAKAGEFYPMGEFNVRLDNVSYTNEALAKRELPKGSHYFTATFTLKNVSRSDARVYWADFKPELIDQDGEKPRDQQYLLKATRNEMQDGSVTPGEETRIRFFFVLPENVKGKTFRLSYGRTLDNRAARVFAFDVANAPSAP